MVNIIMVGCNGKMGRVITDICNNDSDATIVAGVDPFAGVANDYPVFASITECDVKADVIIDFSNPKGLDDLLSFAKKNNTPIVLCTTGFSEEQLAQIKEASKEVAILRSANMSLGINSLMKLLKMATNMLADRGFDIEIVEKHHNQKLDAPSGTAIALADCINEELNNEYEYVYDRSQVRQKRSDKEIGLSAVRGGTIVGEHQIIFAGRDEVIEFKHTAYSKEIFAKGAVDAAKFLGGQPAGMYDMSDVL